MNTLDNPNDDTPYNEEFQKRNEQPEKGNQKQTSIGDTLC